MKFPIYASAGILLTLASFGWASTASAASATGHALTSKPPKFYVETGLTSGGNSAKPQDVVRATATGAITGTFRCPAPTTTELEVAAASNQKFYVLCAKFVTKPKRGVTQSRIFRFQVTASGRATGLSLVPGGTFKGGVGDLAASANGAEVAVTVPAPGNIVVINTKTGAHASWTGGVMPGGEIFNGGQLSLTADGRELAVFGRAHCPKGGAPGSCRSPGEEMRAVSPASAGGKLASGRMVFKQSQLIGTLQGFINDAFINSGGTTLTAGVVFGDPSKSFVEALSVSMATGKTLKVEFRLPTGNGFFYRFIGADPTGQWVLFDAGPTTHAINGWVDHGKLVPLKPAGDNAFDEAWSS